MNLNDCNIVAADHELAKLPLKGIGSCAKVTDGEHGSVQLAVDGIKYLTAENVKQGYVEVERVRYVGPEVDERNARARVREGDVLVSIKGTLGEVGLAQKDLLPANMNRDGACHEFASGLNANLPLKYCASVLHTRCGCRPSTKRNPG